MTHDTHSHPDQPHPDFPKSIRGAPLLSGLPQGEAHDTHKHNIRTTATTHPNDRHTLSGVRPDTLSGCLLQVIRLNQESILVEIVRPPIWQLRGSPGTRGLNIGAVCGSISLIQSPAKMTTPSQSRSSGREQEDNSEWRRAIERRQLASERQLKALFQETERLREENAVLCIQASTSGPPRLQRSRGPGSKLKVRTRVNISWDSGSYPETYNVRPHEPYTPMPRAPREESSDSTHFSTKRQRDRKSQLSNSIRARLGPQEPGRPRSPAATTWAARPDHVVTPMVQNVLPHRDPMVTLMVRNVHSHLAARQDGRNLPNEPPIGSISKRLDDMLFTPFYSHIIH
ncbi:hypothetical protein CK203_017588 [Vitis vinifera]|uniref:Uncharacterized protein n=1 Tax=Vitis vinifera TaxID=29760 RepID=A0A438IXJ8_VITVI|nr:hypothetical protein CK203_017588 [Vitis vinifera]